jgi:hypothetical protein
MINQIPLLFAKKRRSTLLCAARDIITSEDWNTVEIQDSTEQGGISLLLGSNKLGTGKGSGKGGGKEGLDSGVDDLKLPRFLISVQAQTIVETIYQIVGEATGAEPDVATELFFLVKDLIDLYRSLFPVYHAQSLSVFPGRAAVFWNDTQYFCHHCGTLAQVLKRESSDAAQFLVFGTGLDVVPEFRRVGQQWFRFMMRRFVTIAFNLSQRDILTESVAKMCGLSGISDDKRLEVAEGGIRDAVYQYLSLSRVLKSTLPLVTYFEVMGTLLDTLIEAIFQNVQELGKEVTDDDLFQLYYLLGTMDKVREAFEIVKAGKVVERVWFYLWLI